MANMICNYCGAEITTQAVEAEDGHCPECGAIILMRSGNFEDEELLEDEELDFEEEEDEDEDLLYDDEDDDER